MAFQDHIIYMTMQDAHIEMPLQLKKQIVDAFVEFSGLLTDFKL